MRYAIQVFRTLPRWPLSQFRHGEICWKFYACRSKEGE